MYHYTGIGSRETPEKYRVIFTKIASILSDLGLILRSGGACGADSAFEEGASTGSCEIYLPWNNFQNKILDDTIYYNGVSTHSISLAEKYHPAWNKCSDKARKLHARNCHQILGKDLKTPSLFVLCWTKNGKMIGGTSQALRIAKRWNIPIINFGKLEYVRFDGETLIRLTKKYAENVLLTKNVESARFEI